MPHAHRSGIDGIRRIGMLAFGLLLVGCGPPWPPESPRSRPLDDFGGKLESEEIGYVYASREEYEATDGSSEGSTAWGFVHRKGEVTLGFNPFTTDAPQPGYYVESQVEVVYFDDSTAQLRIDPDKGDHLLLINNLFNTVPSVVIPGARLRVGGDVYELREDGWWADGERIHPFAGK